MVNTNKYIKKKYTRRNNKKRGIINKSKKKYFYKKPPQITKINGYNILFLPLKNETSTIVECRIFGGRYLEHKKQSGISHLLEHILISGSKMCKKENCETFLDKNNIISNAFTDNMCTSYYLKGSSNKLNFMLKYLTSIVFDPNITNKLIKEEKKAVKYELEMFMNDPMWMIYKKLYNSLFIPVGYKNSLDWELQSKLVDSITLNDLIEHLKFTRNLNNMLFTISGKYNYKHILKFFKNLKSLNRKIMIPNKIKNVGQCFTLKQQIITFKNSNFKSSNICIAFPINIKMNNEDRGFFGFIINLFSEGLNSILLKKLRIELNLVYSIKININTDECGTVVSIVTSTTDKHTNLVVNEILKLLKLYCKNLLNTTYLENRKISWIQGINNLCLTRPENVSSYYQDQYFVQLNYKDKNIFTINDLINKINNLDKYELRKIICRIFNFKNCIIVCGSKTYNKINIHKAL
tara:strand:- start:1697 stop:3088 length:1392 start_codon:yes stop_codon:yes gene_type:complete